MSGGGSEYGGGGDPVPPGEEMPHPESGMTGMRIPTMSESMSRRKPQVAAKALPTKTNTFVPSSVHQVPEIILLRGCPRNFGSFEKLRIRCFDAFFECFFVQAIIFWKSAGRIFKKCG